MDVCSKVRDAALLLSLLLFASCGNGPSLTGDAVSDQSEIDVIDDNDSAELITDTISDEFTDADQDSFVDTPIDPSEDSGLDTVSDMSDVDGDPPDVCPTDMIRIPGTDYCIDAYEASRPDASATGGGSDFGAARSEAGLVPWNYVSWHEARSACELAGKTLCPTDVWLQACTRDGLYEYPYGDAYDSVACNGADSGFGMPQQTGMFDCQGGFSGIYDMSGNLAEWMSDCREEAGVYVCDIHGSYYASTPDRMTCSEFGTNRPEGQLWVLGFRCCLQL